MTRYRSRSRRRGRRGRRRLNIFRRRVGTRM